MITLEQRAKEISDFLEVPYEEALDRLSKGFIHNHHLVNEDFRDSSPKNDDELLEWYRTTDSYIYELSAFHLDPGFNYMGMCEGAATHLSNLDFVDGKRTQYVLCLGDGVGDLSHTLQEHGLYGIYHDLGGSKTAEFALSRGAIENILSTDWSPPKFGSVDAVIAWDFFEHLTNVEEWARAVYEALVPGGIFQAQNAFGIGDDEHGGSIGMHLVRNNRFEWDWDPLLAEIGFIDLKNGWRQKPNG